MSRTEDFESLFSLLERVIYHGNHISKFYLHILRLGNGILRKLSSTNHTKFIGKLHKLIANVFPLSHRSGVNFKGLYHERITNDREEDAEMEDQSQNILLGSEMSKDTSILSFEFFQNFWLIHKYISDPFQVGQSQVADSINIAI